MSMYDIRKATQQVKVVVFDDVESAVERNMNTEFDGVIPVAIVSNETLNENNDSTFGGDFFGVELSDGSFIGIDQTSLDNMLIAIDKAREFKIVQNKVSSR